MSHEIPEKPLESVGDIFTINNMYLCDVDYHSKFPVMKQVEEFITDNLVITCKICFQSMDCPVK